MQSRRMAVRRFLFYTVSKNENMKRKELSKDSVLESLNNLASRVLCDYFDGRITASRAANRLRYAGYLYYYGIINSYNETIIRITSIKTDKTDNLTAEVVKKIPNMLVFIDFADDKQTDCSVFCHTNYTLKIDNVEAENIINDLEHKKANTCEIARLLQDNGYRGHIKGNTLHIARRCYGNKTIPLLRNIMQLIEDGSLVCKVHKAIITD